MLSFVDMHYHTFGSGCAWIKFERTGDGKAGGIAGSGKRNSGTARDDSRYVPGTAIEEITMRYAIALSAALTALALSGPANAQAVQSGKYCLLGGGGGGSGQNCSFQTMAACEKAKSGENQTCTVNTQTTGSGSGKSRQQ
jgi:hypothetical protein